MLLISNQPGIKKERGTPEWFNNVRHHDILLGTNWEVGTLENGIYPHRHVFSGIASYVTGSHNIKTGVQWSFGKYRTSYDANGDLYQLYQNGVPSFVTVLNTPVYGIERMNADMGTFVQDTWTFKRFTVNAGVRLEYFNASIEEQGVPAGRFAPLRQIARSPDMPNWFDVTPRLGFSYDLFGDAKTALKASFNKFMAGQTTAYPAALQPARDSEREAHLAGSRSAGRISRPTATTSPRTTRSGCPSTPCSASRSRPSGQPKASGVNTISMYSVGIQHELRPGFGTSVNWFRRGAYNLRRTDNDLVSLTDYSPIDIFNPLGRIDLHGLQPPPGQARAGRSCRSERRRIRASAAGTTTASSSASTPAIQEPVRVRRLHVRPRHQRQLRRVECDRRHGDRPEYLPILRRVEARHSAPARVQARRLVPAPVVGNPGEHRLPELHGGADQGGLDAVQRTARYPADCPAPCPANALVVPTLTVPSLTVPLIAPGEKLYPRHNQLDMGTSPPRCRA